MTSDPTPQAKAGGRRRYLSGESELRIRSYGFSHRIYESMVLGMHPEFAYPRRSRVAPPQVVRVRGGYRGPPVRFGSPEPIQVL